MRFVYGVRGSDFVGVPTYFVFTKKNSYVEPSYFGVVLKFFQTKRSALIKNPLKQRTLKGFQNFNDVSKRKSSPILSKRRFESQTRNFFVKVTSRFTKFV